MTRYYALGLLGLALLAAGCGSEGKTLRTVKTVRQDALTTVAPKEAVWEGEVVAHGTLRVPAIGCRIGDYHAGRYPSGRRFHQEGSEFFTAHFAKIAASFVRERRVWINFLDRPIRVAVWCAV